ncbi:uncharacterized protein LALA0_S02e10572g [Lachancea lanzarotensis]|uniref:LALA0S02e10572g1_1 n=1 Tax=Lachancea lanzarotensis TaxID=1245769 RepID=A0A0C7N764_9SACH|nr:uncharacterized protein LALA0_S02e10572g [Lachancea lanzarotensis]CEP61268.1 LALA0S02e10572g1_1 [Lachancea lanzarotensis]
MATTELVQCFEQDAEEYLGRLRFRRRLRSWLSGSTTPWTSCLEKEEKHSTLEFSYDTEQLELLLLLNGLKTVSPSNDGISPMTTQTFPGDIKDEQQAALPRPLRRRGVFELAHRLKNALRRSRKSDVPHENCKETNGQNDFLAVLGETKDIAVESESRSSKRNENSPESCVAPSTNVLTLLQKIKS